MGLAFFRGSPLEHSEARSAEERSREEALEKVQEDGLELENLPADLRADRSIVLAAVRNNGLALRHACESLRADADVVTAAVDNCGTALLYAAPEFRNDRDLVLEAVSCDGGIQDGENEIVFALELAGAALRSDFEVVYNAVSANGCVLQFAGLDMRKNHDIVAAAVSNDGLALQYADPSLQGDKEIVQTAVLDDPAAIEFAASELLDDVEFVQNWLGDLVIFRVTMLSGRSHVTAVWAEDPSSAGSESLVESLASRLGLSDDQVANFELLMDSKPYPEEVDVEFLSQLSGLVTELQLVVKSHKRARLA